ncbi:tRNA(Ile)-lysidine synthase [Chryseobacterium nakagawai]|uniref:tRNA(Ile)-lysidine synthase n=1 Tax=Chryseobacterium nakagawai TaxID=1241982 RepID=A0AAD0YL56_CHRNA|nr:tRNA lysidine(34) synthetase TilS [Chryseobacterium nakagawai]AZA91260.1 tRNA lysidine(34) synthetase TilS [Chryseobacterium nakagawai]VEH22828.1 tRNA(Ile)-lysidine synthase [Chryseobacterium nakagawai]
MLKKSSFRKQLENLIHQPENHSYLLAVSGGADSMALVSLFRDLRDEKQNLEYSFQVAHINYKLRGEDSDRDEKVVQDFCEKNHIRFHLYEVSEKDQKPDNSIQLWARELRYAFFKKIQEKQKLEYLVTAHHLNDQLETFIINLSKAAGINGLSGIPSNDNYILRPLLPFSKQEIYQFTEENNIEFREDLSNKKSDYLRNKIRNEIVPKLLETNDHFLENFKKSSLYLNQTKDFVQKQIQEIENRLTIFNPDHKILSKEKLDQESDFVKFEILKKYGFNQEEEIPKIFKAENNRSFFSKEYQLIINRDELIFTEKNNVSEIEEEIILIHHFDFSENQVLINLVNHIENINEINKRFEWDFDAEKLHFPLYLRKQQDGDEFYPIGFSGKKKVSKFFRDEKLSVLSKEKSWLLCDSRNHILGVIPLRQDRRYQTDRNTQKKITVVWTEEQLIH